MLNRFCFRSRVLLAVALSLAAQFVLPLAARAEAAVPPAAPASSLALPATDDGLPGEGPIRRYDWFQRLWLERRQDWHQRLEADRGSVVFLGDSITQDWGAGLAAAFPGLKVANRGISGDTTRGVLIRLETDVLALAPSAVVLLIGTNDLEEGASPDVISRNLRLILDALEQHNPDLPIVLCELFPSSASQRRPAERIRAINELYRDAALHEPRITLVETWAHFATATGDANPEEFPDLLHPNERGYARWAAALRPILATLGLLEQTAESFAPEPGFVSLFNGVDLTGWEYRPTPPEAIEAARRRDAASARPPARVYVDERVSFAGATATPDGRYRAQAGRIVVTTPPEYRKIQQLWTERDFPESFVLKVEFRATPNADSGVFIRGVQLQVRDYLLAGPYQELTRFRPQDWNELVITVQGREAICTCNGELLEGAFPVPISGPIGLEGDRGQVEYRRIQVQVRP
jgi:lysophospholipase L1-like esterase